MAALSFAPSVIGVPRYIIDLNLPPEQRWNQVIDDYKDQVKAVDEYAKNLVKGQLGATLGPTIDVVIRGILKNFLGRVCYSLEMKAVAERAGMDLGRLMLLQHIYEASACCTSIVVEAEGGRPMHIRCMDWEMDVLKPLTIELDVRKGSQPVFLATSWAGFLGVFTGMRPGQWSCSLNFRVTKSGTFWDNLKSAVSGSWPSGFLIRHLLETEPDFEKASERLATTPLVAPCYLSVAGATAGQGTLITRNPTSEEHRWKLSEQGTIVQTNIDHWSFEESGNVMNSIQRREIAQHAFDHPPSPITADWLWKLLSKSPILNDITIYGTLMVPADRLLHTRLPQSGDGFLPKKSPSSQYCNSPFFRVLPGSASYDEMSQLSTVPPLQPLTCAKCHREYGPFDNPKGQCSHKGEWHATYSDCNYAKCAWGLGASNIGSQHWGCCYSLDREGDVCKASGRHAPPASTDETLADVVASTPEHSEQDEPVKL